MGTPLKKALNDAGLVSTADRLIAIEDDIVLHCGKNHEDAEFRLWIAIQHDADLMAEVFAPVRARTLANRIHDAGLRIGSGGQNARATRSSGASVSDPSPSTGAGHVLRDLQSVAAGAASRESHPADGGQYGIDARREAATVPPDPTEAIRLAAKNNVAALRSRAWRDIEAITVNGRSVLGATTEEALKWADARGLDVARIRALCALIPDPRRPIGEQITDAIADEAMRTANDRNDR
jgi:hypothetical protein